MDEFIVLNPDYRLKNDESRISFSSLEEVSLISDPNWVSFIHPIQASILSFFTHGDTFSECVAKISHFLNIEKQKVEFILAPYIENENAFFTEWESFEIWFPKNVLIRSKKNTLTNTPVSLNYLNCETIDLSKDRFIRGPQSITLMLNNKCVTNCKYCYADKYTKTKEMSTRKILNLIDEAKRLEVDQINIIGGEVFLKKDWDLILTKLVENKMSPGYISTKFPISLEMVKRLKNSGYDNVVQVSLDSLNEQTLHDLIGVSNNYKEKIIQGIKLLQDFGFKIQINTILSKYNSTIEEINSLHKLVKSIQNLVYWEIRVPNKSIYSKDFESVKPMLDQINVVFDHLEKNLKPKTNINILLNKDVVDQEFNCEKCSGDTFGGGVCGALYSGLFILPDGKVTLCEELYWHPQFIVGDLYSKSLQEIWKSKEAISFLNISREFIGKDSICGKCSSFQTCSESHKRCWLRIVRAYGADKWNYPDPLCEKAPLVSSLY